MGICGGFGNGNNMNKSDCRYEPHLTLKEFSIPPSGQWAPRLTGWSLIQVRQGTGYYLQPQSNRELETGAALLVGGQMRGNIRASQLGELSLYSFSVIPARLTGLITLSEQGLLEMAFRKELSAQIFPPQSLMATKMGELYAGRNRGGLLFRLKLLQLFVEVFGNVFGNELEQTVAGGETSDARDRLQVLLRQTPSSELLEMNLNELAQITRCTPRHLNRIFHELVGMSFRDKRAELRLARARELLATSNSKVVEVALESGYKSLSLFNLMFARRFGISPGKWRQKQGNQRDNENNGGKRTKRLVPLKYTVTPFQSKSPVGFADNRSVNKMPSSQVVDFLNLSP
jgi:AraC-like DNA-binding protein